MSKQRRPVDEYSYLLGRAEELVYQVKRCSKPLGSVEVRLDQPKLLSDILYCIEQEGLRAYLVRYKKPNRIQVYFYQDQWVKRALILLKREGKYLGLGRGYLLGLLYGYRSDAIEEFIKQSIVGYRKAQRERRKKK